jgi:hypothetical protein
MMPSRRLLGALVALVFMTSLPIASHAGLGGFADRMKKKATEAVTGKPKPAGDTSTPAAAERAPDTLVVGIDAGTIAQFETGLRAEAARRAEVDAQLKTMKSRDAYVQCTGEWLMSPEGQKLNARFEEASNDPAKLEVFLKDRDAAMAKHCGPDPSNYDYKRKLQASIPLAGIGPSKMSPRQYAIFRERVISFLAKNKQWHQRGESGPGMYVFEPGELDALGAEAARLREMMKGEF